LKTDTQPRLRSGYRLRGATLFDIRAVFRLERVIFPRDAYPYLDLALLFLLPGVSNLKIVAPDGSLAGFVSSMRSWLNQRGWIITLGVAPDHQRNGLGTALLAAAERRMNVPDMRLTVRAGNEPAIALYHNTGYRIIERKPGYYRDGEPGLVMQKVINDPA
jgi:ribosomal protein S18 acetylase RimI-like enzyme